ncbi:MAG: hypothetical protein OEV07_12485 [Gammaproteobacteria bacterium]|nr:hypothetical protein [Gammaproteobacteria bacterium]
MSEVALKDSTTRALAMAITVAFICGLLVSVVAVSLRPIYKANIEAERIAQLELVLGALSDIGRVLTIDNLEARIVDLESGEFDDSIDVATFDAERAAASLLPVRRFPLISILPVSSDARCTHPFTWCGTPVNR